MPTILYVKERKKETGSNDSNLNIFVKRGNNKVMKVSLRVGPVVVAMASWRVAIYVIKWLSFWVNLWHWYLLAQVFSQINVKLNWKTMCVAYYGWHYTLVTAIANRWSCIDDVIVPIWRLSSKKQELVVASLAACSYQKTPWQCRDLQPFFRCGPLLFLKKKKENCTQITPGNQQNQFVKVQMRFFSCKFQIF